MVNCINPLSTIIHALLAIMTANSISTQSRTEKVIEATVPPPPRYKLIFRVPHSSLTACKTAIFATGAGTYPGGNYTEVSFETPGVGEFTPCTGAKPKIGVVGLKERVEEMRVEILCVGREVVEKAVGALKR